MTHRTRRTVLRHGVGAVAAVTVAGCADDAADPGTTAQTDVSSPTPTTARPTPSLSVEDQTTDGSTATVASTAIDGPGWLVIHPEAEDGGPNGGEVLGRRELAPGTYTNVTLELDPPTSSDRTLYAMLHYDDPDDGEFTFPTSGDPAVTNAGGPVITPFTLSVSGDGTVAGGDQDAEPATVTLANSAFTPMRLSADPGTTVEWVNEDGYGHDVTSAQFHDAATEWDHQESLSGGDRVTRTFEDSGVYEYYCTIHGRSSMCGVVLVGDVSLDADLPCE